MKNATNENYEYISRIEEELENVIEGKCFDEDGNGIDMFQWISENALDYEYVIDSFLSYLGIKVYITLGGPTVWIDTRNAEIVIKWGVEEERLHLCYEITEAINEVFGEMFISAR